MIKKIKFLILVTVLSMACSTDTHKSFLEKKIFEQFNKNVQKLKSIVILPNQGCTGCITEVESFLINYSLEKKGVLFILTNIYSQKVLRKKLGDKLYFSDNIYIDSLNSFTNLSFKEAQYPAMIYIDKGKVIKIEYQSPQNPSAIIQLAKLLEKH